MKVSCVYSNHRKFKGVPIIIAAVVGLIVNFIGLRLISDGKEGGHSHGLGDEHSVVSTVSKDKENKENHLNHEHHHKNVENN